MKLEKLTQKEALKYLKAGYHLYALPQGRKVLFLRLQDKILSKTEESSITLDEQMFASLYEDALFYVLPEEEEENVDIKKDEEYYSWRQWGMKITLEKYRYFGIII